MKTRLIAFLFAFSTLLVVANPPIYIAFQWHMHQPIYQPGQSVVESQNSGTFSYNLYDIFNTRSGPYTSWPSNAVNKMASMNHAGAQVSFSGSLVENLNVMESNGKGFSGWKSSWTNMISKKTSLGNQRLEMVAFGYNHPLMPLIDNTDIQKQIEKHKAAFNTNFPGMPYSKGIFPPENAFQEQIIPALKACGLEWAMIDNQHFDRSCVGQPWAKGSSVVEPNKADQINPNPNDWKQLNGLWAPIPISAAWGHRPHWMKYVDPTTGVEYKMIAVPTSTFFGNEDARGGFGALNYENCMSQLESYNTDPAHPILVVLHHDGDNYGGGTDSYYGSNFDGFVSWLNSNPSRFVCTTIQDYVSQFPPAIDDYIHVEAGSWSGAGSDPEFLKWNGDPTNGYSPDRNSWSIITAASNIVKTAEQINPTSTDTKTAWDNLMTGETSCYWYWDGTEDWDVKPTRAANMATSKAMNVVNGGIDLTPPSIYHPQREPYNPGGTEWGTTMPSDFTVWTYVFDVSGLSSVKLKYRTDKDGINPLTSNQNETYAGGDEVNAWQELTMTNKNIASTTTIKPTYKADEFSAQMVGLKDVLVDYYIEATDTKGNVARSFISHVYVGSNNTGGGTGGSISWAPTSPTTATAITITYKNATAASKLHWGVNATGGNWTAPNNVYYPTGTTISTGGAVETPFTLVNGNWEVTIGPFNNPAQAVSSINFVINNGSNNWDNNGGSNYLINVSPVASDNPVGQNFNKTLNINEAYTFAASDFKFNSPKGNSFKGIKILTLPTVGTLKTGNFWVSINQLITDISQLVYTAENATSSFTYKLIDNADLESDATYTATFTVGSITPPTAITVTFTKPTDWGTSGVNIWAWTGSNTNLFATWPGNTMTDNGNGSFSYTFAETISNVNVIFSKNGTPQTVDITGITQSTCFEQNGLSGSKLNVKTVDCTTPVHTPQAILKAIVYPQPAKERFAVQLPNISGEEQFTLSICDVNGKELRKDTFGGTQSIIDRGNLKSGLYILHIKGKKTGQNFSAKLTLN
ncbi:MAG: starch-binding protein [Bacteroidales bacterium]